MNIKKKKRIAAWSCGILATLLLISLAGGWYLFGENIKAAYSITKLENGLYSMEFQGDYVFDEFLKQGGAKSDSDVTDFLASYHESTITWRKGERLSSETELYNSTISNLILMFMEATTERIRQGTYVVAVM